VPQAPVVAAVLLWVTGETLQRAPLMRGATIVSVSLRLRPQVHVRNHQPMQHLNCGHCLEGSWRSKVHLSLSLQRLVAASTEARLVAKPSDISWPSSLSSLAQALPPEGWTCLQVQRCHKKRPSAFSTTA